MAAVETEIAVGGEDDGVGERLGHADEASIGEAHGNIGIFFDEAGNGLDVVGEIEGHDKGATAKQSVEAIEATIAEKVICLG